MTAPSNITQMCKLCHSRKSHLEESIGTDALHKFFDSSAAIAREVFFDDAGMVKHFGNDRILLSDDCLQLVHQHDHNAAKGFGARAYFPTRSLVNNLCTQKYFADYYTRYAWCLMTSVERHDAPKMDRLRRIRTFEDLVNLFCFGQGSASSGSI